MYGIFLLNGAAQIPRRPDKSFPLVSLYNLLIYFISKYSFSSATSVTKSSFYEFGLLLIALTFPNGLTSLALKLII